MYLHQSQYPPVSLSLSNQVVVDQRSRPQVHARLHSLVTPPWVRRSSFQSASRRSPRSLVEDGHALLCHQLVVQRIGTSMWRMCVSEHVTKIIFTTLNISIHFSIGSAAQRLHQRWQSVHYWQQIIFFHRITHEKKLNFWKFSTFVQQMPVNNDKMNRNIISHQGENNTINCNYIIQSEFNSSLPCAIRLPADLVRTLH